LNPSPAGVPGLFHQLAILLLLISLNFMDLLRSSRKSIAQFTLPRPQNKHEKQLFFYTALTAAQ